MPLSTVLGAQSLVQPGVCTTATRPASPYTGQAIYDTTLSQTLAYNGSAWVVQTGGLVLVKAQAVGTAVSSVTVTDAFSSTYENYRIIYYGNSASGNNDLAVTLGSTTTGYYAALSYVTYAGAAAGAGNSNVGSWGFLGTCNTIGAFLDFDLFQPNIANETFMTFRLLGTSAGGAGSGYLNNTTQYTSFTLAPAGGNTLTGGTVFVYGYAKA